MSGEVLHTIPLPTNTTNVCYFSFDNVLTLQANR
jgi:hypothetical protein